MPHVAHPPCAKLGLGAASRGAIPGPLSTMRGHKRLRDSYSFGAVLALLGAVLFRLPELLNPGVVNSDSAIVGLQAMHILRGQWQWFLWGSGYQTTADSVVAAAVFSLMGATPLALMATALLGHLLATLFAYLTLCRKLVPSVALLLVTPLIISPAPTHTYTLHPPRQTALTLVFAAIWLLDKAPSSRRAHTVYAFGAAIAALACFADPYALVFAPGLAVFALMSAWDGTNSRGHILRRLSAMAAGGGIGAIPFVVCQLLPQAQHGPLTLSVGLLSRNWALLKGPCLSWVLGTQVLHQPAGASEYVIWHAPLIIRICQWLGAGVFVASLLITIGVVLDSSFSRELRRLGVMAALAVFVTIGGFLSSVMPMDHFSSRYLVSLVLVTPFLLGVSIHAVRTRLVLAMVAPMIVSFAVSGWLGYEPFVQGLRIVDAGLEANEAELLRELNRRGVKFAMADYWGAYRLTFMFKEQVVVVPLHDSQDRYAPYRREFSRAPRYAYIFDHRRSEESHDTVTSHVAQGLEDQFSVGPFDVYLVQQIGTSS